MNYSINNNHNTDRTFYARLYFVYAENMLMTESEAIDYACNHVDDDDPMAALIAAGDMSMWTAFDIQLYRMHRLIAAGDMSMWTFDEVAQYVANSRDPISVSDRTKKFLADVNVYKTAKYYYKHWDTRHELYMYTDDGLKFASDEAEAYNDEHADQMDVFDVVVCVPLFERLRTFYAWRDGEKSPVAAHA